MIYNYQLALRGLRIHVRSEGEGVPLLLHCGAWGEMRQWRPLVEHLHGCRVITYDAPGIGSSPVPSSPMSMRGLADVGAGILDELGLRSAHVLGVSFGGAVAQQMALGHPRRVDRLVLASTSSAGWPCPAIPRRCRACCIRAATIPTGSPGVRVCLRREDEVGAGTGRGPEHDQAGQQEGQVVSPVSPRGVDQPAVPAVNPARDAGPVRGRCPGDTACGPPGHGQADPVGTAAHGRRRGHLVVLDSPHEVGPVITAFLRGGGERLAAEAARATPASRSTGSSPACPTETPTASVASSA